jgi:ribose transport system substrate-binding protein
MIGASATAALATAQPASRAQAPSSSLTAASCALEIAQAAKVAPLPSTLPCPSNAAANHWTIGIAYQGSNCPYCTVQIAGFQAEAKALGVTVKIENAQFSASLQAQQIGELVAERPSAILVIPVDINAVVPSVARAAAAGIPVIDGTIEVVPAGLKYVKGYVGISDIQAGTEDAQLVADALHGKGNVAIIAGTPNGSTVNRTKGFKDALAKDAPNIHIVTIEYGDFTKPTAFTDTEAVLTRYGSKLQGIYAEDDAMGAGAAEAIHDASKTGTIQLVAMNGSTDGIHLVETGQAYGTLEQSPTLDGAWTVIYTVDWLEGKTPARTVLEPLPPITKANVAKFAPGW